MKNEVSCSFESTRIQNLVKAKTTEIWKIMHDAVMQNDLHTAQLYTVADNWLNELIIANIGDVEHAVMEAKASIRAHMRKEDVDVFQLQKQFTALRILVEMLQAYYSNNPK
jgi:hypothetical protein